MATVIPGFTTESDRFELLLPSSEELERLRDGLIKQRNTNFAQEQDTN